MTLICLTGEKTSNLLNYLEKLGYNRVISYRASKGSSDKTLKATNKSERIVTEAEFRQLIEKGMLIDYIEQSDGLYGLAKPIGSNLNILETEPSRLNKIKGVYGAQVVSVHIKSSASSSLPSNLFDVVIDSGEQIEHQVASILNHLKRE